MFDDTAQSSPSSAIVALEPLEPEWQPILHASNQVVLYNPTSHALSIQRRSPPPRAATVMRRVLTGGLCPYCHRSISNPRTLGEDDHDSDPGDMEDTDDSDFDESPRSRAANYFQLLQVANESSSVPPTPRSPSPELDSPGPSTFATSTPFRADNMAEGYFKAFFREECRLGMGANGSVFLCQHVLDGNPLGHFAVKKVAVGQSHAYLISILREVRLIEKLHHPNIITYHHAWLEPSQFSSFGPKVPTLHILMQWAEGGSLDDFIDARLGRSSSPHIPHVHPPTGQTFGPTPAQPESTSKQDAEPQTSTPYSRGARIRAFRALQRAPPEERERLRREMAMSSAAGQQNIGGAKSGSWLAVHLLSAEEVKSLFTDVVEGLVFLHDKSILHLDLKPGNVLLTWDEGNLIPRAMLSDFGTSQDTLNSRARSGNTGTLEYTSPESLPSPAGVLQQIDSKSDMWSLGMILYKLLFFRLPYRHASDNVDQSSRTDGKETADQLEWEVRTYPGFKSNAGLVSTFRSRRLPASFLLLLERLLSVSPSSRPPSERVLIAIKEGNFDPEPHPSRQSTSKTSLVPILRRGNVGSEESSVPSPVPGASQNGRIQPIDSRHEDEETTPVSPTAPTGLGEKAGTNPPSHGLPALPSPDDDSGGFPASFRPDKMRRWVSRLLLLRTLKSCILVVKVLTLPGMCATNKLSIFTRSLALGLAVMDTWFDGLRISIVLGLAHVGLMWWSC